MDLRREPRSRPNNRGGLHHSAALAYFSLPVSLHAWVQTRGSGIMFASIWKLTFSTSTRVRGFSHVESLGLQRWTRKFDRFTMRLRCLILMKSPKNDPLVNRAAAKSRRISLGREAELCREVVDLNPRCASNAGPWQAFNTNLVALLRWGTWARYISPEAPKMPNLGWRVGR